jgi:hypothetical protein
VNVVGRYYDPATGQFLSVDPMVDETRESYAYTGGDPVNEVDPLGLNWWDPFSWTGKTWATIGTVTGGLALAATGVGALADAGVIGGEAAETVGVAAGYVGVTAGGVSTATDLVPCVTSFGGGGIDGPACAGAGAGLLTLGFGGASLLGNGLTAAANVGLDAGGFAFGAGTETFNILRIAANWTDASSVGGRWIYAGGRSIYLAPCS